MTIPILGSSIYQLLHDEHALKSKFGFEQSLKESRDIIKKVLSNMKIHYPDLAYGFLYDLIKRGTLTIQNDFDEYEKNHAVADDAQRC